MPLPWPVSSCKKGGGGCSSADAAVRRSSSFSTQFETGPSTLLADRRVWRSGRQPVARSGCGAATRCTASRLAGSGHCAHLGTLCHAPSVCELGGHTISTTPTPIMTSFTIGVEGDGERRALAGKGY